LKEDFSLDLEKAAKNGCAVDWTLLEYESDPSTTVVRDFLEWFCDSTLETTFYPINVDSSLDENHFVSTFGKIRKTARKLRQSDAMIVVFLDGRFHMIELDVRQLLSCDLTLCSGQK
jgi:ketosteroid isomerase-like protein